MLFRSVRASNNDSTATSAIFSYRSEPSETPSTNRRKASCTDSGFMPWSQDVDDVDESDAHFLTEVRQSAVQETFSDQGLHTLVSAATQAPGIREARHASYNSAYVQEREDVTSSRVARPAAPPTTLQNQNFFSPSPSPSDYSLTRALLGFNELFASSQGKS